MAHTYSFSIYIETVQLAGNFEFSKKKVRVPLFLSKKYEKCDRTGKIVFDKKSERAIYDT